MRQFIVFIQILCCFTFANDDLYTDDYYFRNNPAKIVKKEVKSENNATKFKKSKPIVENTKPHKKTKYYTRTKKVGQPYDRCDILRAMSNKTFYNPSKHTFFIDQTEYKEIPQEFKDCGIFFESLERENINLSFGLDTNETISGVIQIPDDELDENFFYEVNLSQKSLNLMQEVKKNLAECNFIQPYGIRTALDDYENIIHLPSSYINQTPKLYFENTQNGVFVSNNGFGKIKISTENFAKNCKVAK